MSYVIFQAFLIMMARAELSKCICSTMYYTFTYFYRLQLGKVSKTSIHLYMRTMRIPFLSIISHHCCNSTLTSCLHDRYIIIWIMLVISCTKHLYERIKTTSKKTLVMCLFVLPIKFKHSRTVRSTLYWAHTIATLRPLIVLVRIVSRRYLCRVHTHIETIPLSRLCACIHYCTAHARSKCN